MGHMSEGAFSRRRAAHISMKIEDHCQITPISGLI